MEHQLPARTADGFDKGQSVMLEINNVQNRSA